MDDLYAAGTTDTLYVTDLDGTLLRSDDRISSFSIETINELVRQGMKFTYATARSLSSASIVTQGLTLNLPVIVYNGAFIREAVTGKVLYSVSFSEEERADVRKVLTESKIYPLVYTFLEEAERVLWYTQMENEGMRRYLSMRKQDKRMLPLSMGEELYRGEIFYYTCIGEKQELIRAYELLKGDSRYTCTLQQELYRPEYWLEIMPGRATKAQAILELKKLWGCDRIVSFGDAVNDIPMFGISDECYAVGNAVEALKACADGVLATNEEDAVAKFLLGAVPNRNFMGIPE